MITLCITTYKNGELLNTCESVEYASAEIAISVAQKFAEHFSALAGGSFQSTADGAIRMWSDEEGNQFRREYHLNK